jgi:GR25 family glycosyltransferase involved in LPS biosynthesis
MQHLSMIFLLQQLAFGFVPGVSISPLGETAHAAAAVVRRAQERNLHDVMAAENGITKLLSLSANATSAVRLEKNMRRSNGLDSSGKYLKALDFRNIKFYAINVEGGVQNSKYIEKKFGVHVDPIESGRTSSLWPMSWIRSFTAGFSSRSMDLSLQKQLQYKGDMMLQDVKGFELWIQAPPEVEWFVRLEDDAVVDDTLLTEIQYVTSMRPDARVIWLDNYHQHCGFQAGKDSFCGSDLEAARTHTGNAMFHRTVIPLLLQGYDHANQTSYINSYVKKWKDPGISGSFGPEEFLGSLVRHLKISSAKHGIVKHRTEKKEGLIERRTYQKQQQEGHISRALDFQKVGFYVINLADSVERWKNFKHEVAKLGIQEITRIDAVDARKMQIEELDSKCPMCLPRGDKNLGYKGLYLSEVRSYEVFLTAPPDIEWFVRFEDDAVFDEHLLADIQYITTMRPEARVIWLDRRAANKAKSYRPAVKHCGQSEPPCSYQGPGECCHAGIMFHRDILPRLLAESVSSNPNSFINRYGEVDHYVGNRKVDQMLAGAKKSATSCLNDWFLPHVVSYLQIPATVHGVVGGSMSESTIHLGKGRK